MYDIYPDWMLDYYDDDYKQELIVYCRWYFSPYYPYWLDTRGGRC